MVEEYEEIADSQYQSERQELFDEDYGKQTSAYFAIQTWLLLATWLIPYVWEMIVKFAPGVHTISVFLGVTLKCWKEVFISLPIHLSSCTGTN